MSTGLIITGTIALAIAIFVVYRLVKVRLQNRRLNNERFERIKPLYEKLGRGDTVTTADVLPYAKNLRTRETAYLILGDYNKSDLFPAEYVSIVKGAESNLANWLEFPTELDACPDEMEHVKRVTFDEQKPVHYEVFRYRVNEPHWAAKNGWILGVVGPYFDDSKPYDHPTATFSRVSSRFDAVAADDEAQWVHQNVAMK